MADIRGVLFDLAGVLHDGDERLPGARRAVDAVERAGLPYRYVTNTSRLPRRAVVERLHRLGLPVPTGSVFTAPMAARSWLAKRSRRPHLLATPELAEDFQGLGEGAPDAVFVADAAEGFTYAAMNEAFRLLMEGAPLLAVGRNRYFRSGEALCLDAGPYIRALEYAADVEATVVGKPAAAFFHAATDDMGCAPGEALMVGDDVEADVLGALDAGLRAVLARTGKYRTGDEARLEATHAMAEDTALAAVSKSLFDR